MGNNIVYWGDDNIFGSRHWLSGCYLDMDMYPLGWKTPGFSVASLGRFTAGPRFDTRVCVPSDLLRWNTRKDTGPCEYNSGTFCFVVDKQDNTLVPWGSGRMLGLDNTDFDKCPGAMGNHEGTPPPTDMPQVLKKGEMPSFAASERWTPSDTPRPQPDKPSEDRWAYSAWSGAYSRFGG